MFMQRTSSGTFLPNSHAPDLDSFDQSVDPFLTDLTADMYIDPPTAEQEGFPDANDFFHTPPANFNMPQDDVYDPSTVEDLWANIMSFDQSANEDVQPMPIPNVIGSLSTNNSFDLSQSCPQSTTQRTNNAANLNYPAHPSPLASQRYVHPTSPVRVPSGDKKGRPAPAIREQGGIRALFSAAGPRAPQIIDKQPLRRSSSAHGKLGVRKKSQLSPRIKKAALPAADAVKLPSEMQATYRLNQQLASVPDAFNQAQSAPLPPSPLNIQFRDPFNGVPASPVVNSFSGFEEPMELERRRSTSLPPMTPSSHHQLNASNNFKNIDGSPFSAPNTPAMSVRSMPIKIPRTSKVPSQPVAMSAEEQQRHLDDQLLKIDFDDITVAELKDMLRERKKATNGKKADLVQRLLDERRMVELKNEAVNNTGHTSFSMPNKWLLPSDAF